VSRRAIRPLALIDRLDTQPGRDVALVPLDADPHTVDTSDDDSGDDSDEGPKSVVPTTRTLEGVF
jgi:hypothetical protein